MERPSIVAHRRWETVTTPLLREDMNWERPFTSPTLLHCTGFQCKLPRGSGEQPGLVIKLPSWQYHIVFSVTPLSLPQSHTARQSRSEPRLLYTYACAYRAIYLNSRPHRKSHTSKKENTFNSTSTKTEMKMTPGNTELPIPVSKFTCG